MFFAYAVPLYFQLYSFAFILWLKFMYLTFFFRCNKFIVVENNVFKAKGRYSFYSRSNKY